MYTHTRTHTHTYIYTYICVCIYTGACDHVTTYIRPKIRRITDKSLTNRAIDLRSRGWSYEQIWSQQGRWSCSKLWPCDGKTLEVAYRSYKIMWPVVQGRTINRAWSWADKSCYWSVACCEHGSPSITKVHFSKFSIATNISFNWIPVNQVNQVFRFS